MTKSRNRDFTGFQSNLAAAIESPTTPPHSESPPPTLAEAAPSAKRGPGRPTSDTEPLQLRITPTMRRRLAALSAKEALETGRVPTVQQIILRILEEKLGG
jgi:hypothetical protein